MAHNLTAGDPTPEVLTPLENIEAPEPKTWEEIETYYRSLGAKAMQPLRDIVTNSVTKLEAIVNDASRSPTERDEARDAIVKIRGFDAVLDDAEAMLATRPQKLLEGLAERLMALEIPVDGEAFAALKLKLEALGAPEKREIEHLARVLRSNDPTSILIGGHVFIDTALEDCFEAYLPHRLNLHDDLQLFTSGKIKLAFALGMITESEKTMLARFNKIRNKVAHRTKPVGTPRFIYDREQERILWAEFIRNPTYAGAWRPYNEDEFPAFTRLMVLAIYYHLSIRIGVLKDKPLTDIAELPTKIAGVIYPALITLMAKALLQVTNEEPIEKPQT